MAAATVNEKFILSGENEEMHDVTFAATADTYACGVAVKAYTFSVKSATGGNANAYHLAESAGTFTLTATGTPNTDVRVWIRILKKR